MTADSALIFCIIQKCLVRQIVVVVVVVCQIYLYCCFGIFAVVIEELIDRHVACCYSSNIIQ